MRFRRGLLFEVYLTACTKSFYFSIYATENLLTHLSPSRIYT